MLPPKYLANLTPQQRLLQARLIAKSQKEYQETGKVKERPEVSAAPTSGKASGRLTKGQSKRSVHAARFQERFGFPITDLKKVKAEFPNTDVAGILAKGRAAYASSGSRPNTSSNAWAFARLASVLTGGKALGVDKDLVGDKDKEKIKE